MRHPLDPDVTRDSKASAVLALGITALLTGVVLGGVVPATLALMLGRQAKADLYAGSGFLIGARRLRTGTVLAWSGIVLAVATVVVALIAGLLGLAASPGGPDFDSNVD